MMRSLFLVIFFVTVSACGKQISGVGNHSGGSEIVSANSKLYSNNYNAQNALFDISSAPQGASDIRAWITSADPVQWNSPVPASSLEVERYRDCLTKIQNETRELWDAPAHTVDAESLQLANWGNGGIVGFALASDRTDRVIPNDFLYVIDMRKCQKMFGEYELSPVTVSFDTESEITRFNLSHHDPDTLLSEYRVSKYGRQVVKFYGEQVDAILFRGGSALDLCAQKLQHAPKATALVDICDVEATLPYSIKAFTMLTIYDFSPEAVSSFEKGNLQIAGSTEKILPSPAGDALMTEFFYTNKDQFLVDEEFIKHITTKYSASKR